MGPETSPLPGKPRFFFVNPETGEQTDITDAITEAGFTPRDLNAEWEDHWLDCDCLTPCLTCPYDEPVDRSITD